MLRCVSTLLPILVLLLSAAPASALTETVPTGIAQATGPLAGFFVELSPLSIDFEVEGSALLSLVVTFENGPGAGDDIVFSAAAGTVALVDDEFPTFLDRVILTATGGFAGALDGSPLSALSVTLSHFSPLGLVVGGEIGQPLPLAGLVVILEFETTATSEATRIANYLPAVPEAGRSGLVALPLALAVLGARRRRA